MSESDKRRAGWVDDLLFYARGEARYFERCKAILRKAGLPESDIAADLEGIVHRAGLTGREFEDDRQFETALKTWAWKRRDELAARAEQPAASAGPAEAGGDTFVVTLLQAAAIASRSKRTLERWQLDDHDFPLPICVGGGGKAAEWRWSDIRPYLEKRTGRRLPKVHPADRLNRAE